MEIGFLGLQLISPLEVQVSVTLDHGFFFLKLRNFIFNFHFKEEQGEICFHLKGQENYGRVL